MDVKTEKPGIRALLYDKDVLPAFEIWLEVAHGEFLLGTGVGQELPAQTTCGT